MTATKLHAEEALPAEIIAFRDKFRSAILATVDSAGVPEASYAPFIVSESGAFHVFVSLLARHTGNMLDQGIASVMFIEEEANSNNVFARRRLVYQCSAHALARDNEDWPFLMAQFDTRFGKFMETLKALPDFQLVRLVPQSGSYVTGFGKAYRLTGNELHRVQHIGPDTMGEK